MVCKLHEVTCDLDLFDRCGRFDVNVLNGGSELRRASPSA
jgi:hypothetical protein